MSLFEKIKLFCKNKHLFSVGNTIVIGLSGGPDSVFLLHFFIAIEKIYNLQLIVAHLNHEWRASADHDEQFCKELAEKYKIPFVGQKLSSMQLHIKYNGSKEEYARNARRLFFEQVAQKYSASAVALAHHADDQVETFFIRLARGTSLTGLTCMQPQNGLYIRPLLSCFKSEILHYLNEHGLHFCIDETNESHDFLRNRIRHFLSENLDTIDARFSKNVLRTVDSLAEVEAYLELHTKNTLHELCTNNDHGIKIDSFLLLHHAIQKRIIIGWFIQNKIATTFSKALVDEVIRFIKQSKSKTHEIDNTKIIKTNGYLYVHTNKK